jgi:hypothetical protein
VRFFVAFESSFCRTCSKRFTNVAAWQHIEKRHANSGKFLGNEAARKPHFVSFVSNVSESRNRRIVPQQSRFLRRK